MGLISIIFKDGLRNHWVYDISPPSVTIPRWTVSPFSLRMSSMRGSFPSFVPSLNQPRWSAIKCLQREFRRRAAKWTKRTLPIFAFRTLHQNYSFFISLFWKLMCWAVTTARYSACERDLQPGNHLFRKRLRSSGWFSWWLGNCVWGRCVEMLLSGW